MSKGGITTVMKNRFRESAANRNEKKLDSMFRKSVEALSEEQYDLAAQNDAEILKYIGQLSKKQIPDSTKNSIVNYFFNYTRLLRSVNLFQKDEGYINRSISLICDDLLSGDSFISLFNERQVYEYVVSIMSAITTRPDSYDALFRKYIKGLNPLYKARAIAGLLPQPAGKISYEEEILPLLDEYKAITRKRYELEKKLDPAERGLYRQRTIRFITDINILARRTFTEINDEDIIDHELSAHSGEASNEIVNLISEVIAQRKCIDLIRKWIKSIEEKDGDPGSNWNYLKVRGWMFHYETGKRIPWKEGNAQEGTFPWLNKVLTSDEYSEKEKHDQCVKFHRSLMQEFSSEEDCIKKMSSLNRVYLVKDHLRCFSYWDDFRDALDCVDIRDHSYENIVFCAPFRKNTVINASYALPVMLCGKKKGAQLVPMSVYTFNAINADPELNGICRFREGGSVFRHYDASVFKHPLTLDIEHKKIMLGEYNVYEPVYEEASRCQFTMEFDFNDAWIRSRCYTLLSMYDRALEQCEMLEEYAVRHGKQIYFILTSYHMYEFAAIRIYCETRGRRYGLKVIGTRSGYDNYFDSKSDNSVTISMLNLTDHPTKRLPFYGTDEGFNKYYADHRNEIASMREKADMWFTAQRSDQYDSQNVEDIRKREAILDRIKKHKEKGGKIYLLIGKLVFDLCVYWTEGTAHRDMSDWATDTVKTISGDDNILLLIKPHPHETRSDVTMSVESITTFRDIIKCDLPENSIYLEGHLFRNFDLLDHIDLGLVWNSTSALELAAKGIKVVMGDVFGYYDYPIGLPRYDSREEYENAILNCDSIESSQELSDKAICFLNYMGSEDVSVKNPYTSATMTNYHIYDAKIHMDAVKAFDQNGDDTLQKKVGILLGDQ